MRKSELIKALLVKRNTTIFMDWTLSLSTFWMVVIGSQRQNMHDEKERKEKVGVQITPSYVYEPMKGWCVYEILYTEMLICISFTFLPATRHIINTVAAQALIFLSFYDTNCKHKNVTVTYSYTSRFGTMCSYRQKCV